VLVYRYLPIPDYRTMMVRLREMSLQAIQFATSAPKVPEVSVLNDYVVTFIYKDNDGDSVEVYSEDELLYAMMQFEKVGILKLIAFVIPIKDTAMRSPRSHVSHQTGLDINRLRDMLWKSIVDSLQEYVNYEMEDVHALLTIEGDTTREETTKSMDDMKPVNATGSQGVTTKECDEESYANSSMFSESDSESD